jgi:hypothetical protein
MRHLVLALSMGLLVSFAGIAEANQEARPRLRRVRPEVQTPAVRTPPPAEDPTPAPTPATSPTTPVIAEDGAVETAMPDGSVKRARPGDCGWTVVRPDGTKNSIACIHVPKANLPAPQGESAAWLVAHGDSLLEIARKLLGGDATSLNNYLQSVESENPGVYERIRLRTDLLTKLTAQ